MSDHGEEVFDNKDRNFYGRDESNPTKSMNTIPFILWTSKKWQKTYLPLNPSITDRPYCSSDLIYTFIDLAGFQYDGLEPSKSLINSNFKEQPLLIGNPYERMD